MTSTPRSLVVGHDGSPGAVRALELAARLASATSAPLRVLRTWGIDPDPAVAMLLLDESQTHDQIATTIRDALVHDCEPVALAHPGLDISYEAIAGPAASVLCAAANDDRMLVLGARGHGGLTGLLLGSVSDRCLHLSKRPVLVVPPEERSLAKTFHHTPVASGVEDAGAVPTFEAGTIVVGYDGSEHARRALSEALDLAEEVSAPVAVVQSWTFETAPAGSVWKDGAVSPLPEISRAVRDQLAAGIAAECRLRPTVSVSCFAVLGNAAEILVRASENAWMLVLGSRGLGGFSGLVMGSVSMQCAHRARCAVLVVPASSLPQTT